MYDSGKKKGVIQGPNLRPATALAPITAPADPLALQRQVVATHTFRPATVQRQVAGPALKAVQIHGAEVQRLSEERSSVQRQAAEISLPQSAVSVALQRQQAVPAPVPTKPQSIGDWVTVMRFQAEQSEGRRMGAKEAAQFTALQRQVAQTLSRSYLTNRQSALQRQQDYAGHVVALQRHPVSGQVARAFMLSVPQSERAALQRAVDEAQLNEQIQRQQEEQALRLHTLQRQLAELNQQATQPVFERIQQRRGAGNPLPEAVQRHLEHGLNHDLSAVRIHDDAEADKLAKGVNAIAFTTSTDIYFQSGKFNPNSQSGLELLAHEVTHAVQQSKGQVGKGVDPDSGLESEARNKGQELSQTFKKQLVPQPRRLKPMTTPASFKRAALQRLQDIQPSRRWQQEHAFAGNLNAPGGPLQISITKLQVITGGVVVGRFTAPNGGGRIDGFMDAQGKLYWTAKYENGNLKGKERKFHGQVQFSEGGTPKQVKGEWLGQGSQGQGVRYSLSAERQAPDKEPNNSQQSGFYPVPATLKLPNGTTIKLDPKDFSNTGNYSTTTDLPAKPGESTDTVDLKPTSLVENTTRNLLASAKGIQLNQLQSKRSWTATEFLAQGRDYGGLTFKSGLSQVHTGWDLNTNSENIVGGSNAKAVADGIIWFAGWTDMGNTIILYHPQLQRHTRYGHLKDKPSWTVGAIVKAGTNLGVIGSTNTNGSHLHFDVITKYVTPGMWNGKTLGKDDNKKDITQDTLNNYVKDHYEDPMGLFARLGVKIPGLSDEQMKIETSKNSPGGTNSSETLKDFSKETQQLLNNILNEMKKLDLLSASNMTVERSDSVDHSINVNLPLILADCLRSGIENASQVAYVLATAYHETRLGTPKFQRSVALQEDANPVKRDQRGQYRKNHVTGRRVNGTSMVDYFNEAYGRNTGLGNRLETNDGYDYRGQGFVQLTGRYNYKTLSDHLNSIGFSYVFNGITYGTSGKKIDLISNPGHVSAVDGLSSKILVEGMKIGAFRGGKKLENYFNKNNNDFYNARDMINGDKVGNGNKVADEAKQFLKSLIDGEAWAKAIESYKKGEK